VRTENNALRQLQTRPPYMKTNTNWKEEFLGKFFVYRMKGGQPDDHVGAQNEAIEFIERTIDNRLREVLEKVQGLSLEGELYSRTWGAGYYTANEDAAAIIRSYLQKI